MTNWVNAMIKKAGQKSAKRPLTIIMKTLNKLSIEWNSLKINTIRSKVEKRSNKAPDRIDVVEKNGAILFLKTINGISYLKELFLSL